VISNITLLEKELRILSRRKIFWEHIFWVF